MESYIPEDAKWFLAEIIEEIKVEDEPQNVVHINTVLVGATTAEEAYSRAMELGRESQHSYENTEGKLVTVTFRGLHDLNVIHDELEHGAELIYEQNIGVDENEIKKMVSAKEQLGVFRPRKPTLTPNYYMPGDIAEELKRAGYTPEWLEGSDKS
jgi:hypothetical protein